MPDGDWVKYRRLRGRDLPARIELRSASYARESVFKHDFYAATGLYRRCTQQDTAAPERVVLKIYHAERFAGLSLGWLGRWLARREIRLHRALAGIGGIPRLLEPYAESGLVREFVPGCNLREFKQRGVPNSEFFPFLERTLEAVHARRVCHNDLSKPENVLVREDGTPVLIDFQIAYQLTTRLPGLRWLMSRIVRYQQGVDRYHLHKLHRRSRPQDFTADELKALSRKGILLRAHALVRIPYRAVRHVFLAFLRTGAKGTPTALAPAKRQDRAA